MLDTMKAILDEHIEDIVEILNSDDSLVDQVRKILKYISLDEWEFIYKYMDYVNYPKNELMRKIGINYKYFKANGLFDKYKDSYKCSMQVAYRRLEVLKNIEIILNSYLTDVEKLCEILFIFPTYESFKKSYSLFIKFGSKDERLNKYRSTLDNYEYIDSYIKRLFEDELMLNNAMYRNEMRTLLDNDVYLENYLYAEWVIKKFLSYERNHLKHEFLKKVKISNETFEYCVSVIELLNPVLYKEYQETLVNCTEKRVFNLDKTFLNLEQGINTGYLKDGTHFNVLEFLKRVPFKNSGRNFFYAVCDYLTRTYGYGSKTYNTIVKYLYDNNIKSIVFVNKKYYEDNQITLKGVLITPDIVDVIFEYMDAYGLPHITKVFRIVFDMYINGRINDDEVKEKLARFDENKEKEYNNPYVLIKKRKEV